MVKNKKKFFVGRNIRSKYVFLIDSNNSNKGKISKEEALKLAEKENLDLVQVGKSGDIPACKIMDYGKFKFDMSKKEKAAAKKQKESSVKTKEIRLRPSTEGNDLLTKAKQAKKFMENGCNVKLNVQFKGREMSHKSLGEDVLTSFLGKMEEIGCSSEFRSEPATMGKTLSVFLCKSNLDKHKKAS